MDTENFPEHIAIIMDGNRRWARQKNLPIKVGHKTGADTLEKITKYANKIGVKYLTVYAFSTENWNRSKDEVNALMILLKNYVDDFAKRADLENIKIQIIGDIERLSKDLQDSIKRAVDRTVENTGLLLNIAFNYGGRAEILKATKELAQDAKDGKISVDEIDEKLFEKHLYTYPLPDPDLMIRTSGEMRISGFLIWQMSYTEYVFVDKYWPDFSEKDLDEAIEVYQKRNRKFGAK